MFASQFRRSHGGADRELKDHLHIMPCFFSLANSVQKNIYWQTRTHIFSLIHTLAPLWFHIFILHTCRPQLCRLLLVSFSKAKSHVENVSKKTHMALRCFFLIWIFETVSRRDTQWFNESSGFINQISGNNFFSCSQTGGSFGTILPEAIKTTIRNL